jgi:hypothetical protein
MLRGSFDVPILHFAFASSGLAFDRSSGIGSAYRWVSFDRKSDAGTH